MHLTRDELETLAGPVLSQTVDVTQALIRWANLAEGRLAGVFLVGGASRIPLVATLLHRALGEPPVVIEQPELVVAEGSILADAALLATGPAAPGPDVAAAVAPALRTRSGPTAGPRPAARRRRLPRHRRAPTPDRSDRGSPVRTDAAGRTGSGRRRSGPGGCVRTHVTGLVRPHRAGGRRRPGDRSSPGPPARGTRRPRSACTRSCGRRVHRRATTAPTSPGRRSTRGRTPRTSRGSTTRQRTVVAHEPWGPEGNPWGAVAAVGRAPAGAPAPAAARTPSAPGAAVRCGPSVRRRAGAGRPPRPGQVCGTGHHRARGEQRPAPGHSGGPRPATVRRDRPAPARRPRRRGGLLRFAAGDDQRLVLVGAPLIGCGRWRTATATGCRCSRTRSIW